MKTLGKVSFLVCGISILILFILRYLMGGWMSFLYAPLIIGILSFWSGVIVEFRFFRDFLSMRTTKHGLNMGVMIILAFVFLAAINYLGVRFDKSFDMTTEKINTLSDQSLSILKSLDSDLDILIFYKTNRLKEMAIKIKEDFSIFEKSSDRIKIKLVNSDFDVELANKFLTNGEAIAAVVNYKNNHILLVPEAGEPSRPIYTESSITSALLKATREKEMTIYFLTGHGEKDIDRKALDGLGIFNNFLTGDGYKVAKINLITGDKLPEPPNVLAIIGPKVALGTSELDEIRNFVNNGGRLMIAADPGEKHQIALLTKSFGVEFGNNYILNEVAGSDDGVSGAVGVGFDKTHEVTQKIPEGAIVIFPYASEVKKAPDAPSDNAYVELIKSHPKSFVFNAPHGYPKNPERESHIMAIAVENPKSRLVVFGDSDFLTDFRINAFSHVDLAMNAVAYLFGDSTNVTIRPKRLVATQLILTGPQKATMSLAGIGLPLVLIIFSGVAWYRRRNL